MLLLIRLITQENVLLCGRVKFMKMFIRNMYTKSSAYCIKNRMILFLEQDIIKEKRQTT